MKIIEDIKDAVGHLLVPLLVVLFGCMIPVAMLLAIVFGIVWILKHFGVI